MTQSSSNSASAPRHIAIIMDGNGRWAKKRFLPRVAGHVKGVDAVKTTIEACVDRGVEFLTIFAFSSENWKRPEEEVSYLMGLFVKAMEREVDKMHENGICFRVIGDISRFDQKLKDTIAATERKTANNKKLVVNVCANYGGRWDIMQAVNKMIAQEPTAKEFTEAQLAPHLALSFAPEPDLFIRTGGEQRISNYLLWQLAYTELYFTDIFWPDFNEAELDLAIAAFNKRERRFGHTSEQVAEQKKAS
jgi:undecaprenyl diphosphate synthase